MSLKKNMAKIPVASRHDYTIEVKDFDRDRNLSKLPEKMMEVLYNFQKEGIEYGVRRYGRLLLGDEMGVGKTIQGKYIDILISLNII